MFFELNRTIQLTHEWTAEFIFRYQVRMCTDGWGLALHGPNGLSIRQFEEYIMDCDLNEENWTEENLRKIFTFSPDSRFLQIKTTYDGDWLLEFSSGAIAPVRDPNWPR